jgi:CheY-like chemotaxis protein
MSRWSRRPLVLLAEDEADIRGLLTTLLERWGYDVAAASSGAEALELAGRLRPTLAVLDVSMPAPDGLEVTRRLKADPAFADVPVILLTAHADVRGAAASAAGACAYVTKPFRAQALRKAIWSAVPSAPDAA